MALRGGGLGGGATKKVKINTRLTAAAAASITHNQVDLQFLHTKGQIGEVNAKQGHGEEIGVGFVLFF